MALTVLNVPDISCEHCERTITSALTPLEGIRSVNVDIPRKQVHVDYDEAHVSVDQMKDVLEEEEYPVASSRAGRFSGGEDDAYRASCATLSQRRNSTSSTNETPSSNTDSPSAASRSLSSAA